MKLSQVVLHRSDLILIKQIVPYGETQSGIYLQHSETLPAIFGDVVLVPPGAPVSPGDFIVFPRYAGDRVELEEGVFHFIHKDDIEAIIDLSAGVLY